MTLDLIVPTTERQGYEEGPASWFMCATEKPALGFVSGPVSDGVLFKLQQGYKNSQADILCYLHDDVACDEDGWDLRVLAEFDDPQVGIVGFGGALGHGSKDIYKVPYHISQLGRSFYRSNVRDAEVHGERFKGVCDVATLDGFALVIRRELLCKLGGWPVETYPPFHVYDHFVTLAAHRLGYRVRLVGVACHHWGGMTSVREPAYEAWARTTKWGSDAEMHAAGHRMLYEDFRDVLPVWMEEQP